jgi:hypothetical protein
VSFDHEVASAEDERPWFQWVVATVPVDELFCEWAIDSGTEDDTLLLMVAYQMFLDRNPHIEIWERVSR